MGKLFILLNIFLISILTFYLRKYILTDDLLINFYSTQLTENQINNLLIGGKKWESLSYIAIPVYYLIKITIISIALFTGFFFFNIKAKFSKIFNAVVFADMILLVPQIIKIIWFSFQSDYTLEDIQYFFPGSALSMFDPTAIQKWLLYPLQALNIFEFSFWLLLAWQLKEYSRSRSAPAE